MTELILMATVPALLVFFLDFTFGRPSDERPGYNDIFFFYTFALCKWKLARLGMWKKIRGQYRAGLYKASTKLQRIELRRQLKETVFQNARPYFTWENAAGMCPVCFHFWVSVVLYTLANYFYFSVNIFCFVKIFTTFVVPFLTGHLLIRTLKKFI